jgi:hypothetical protein
MQILGLPGGFTRPPFAHLDDAATASLIPRMRALELPEWQGRIPAS